MISVEACGAPTMAPTSKVQNVWLTGSLVWLRMARSVLQENGDWTDLFLLEQEVSCFWHHPRSVQLSSTVNGLSVRLQTAHRHADCSTTPLCNTKCIYSLCDVLQRRPGTEVSVGHELPVHGRIQGNAAKWRWIRITEQQRLQHLCAHTPSLNPRSVQTSHHSTAVLSLQPFSGHKPV